MDTCHYRDSGQILTTTLLFLLLILIIKYIRSSQCNIFNSSCVYYVPEQLVELFHKVPQIHTKIFLKEGKSISEPHVQGFFVLLDFLGLRCKCTLSHNRLLVQIVLS